MQTTKLTPNRASKELVIRGSFSEVVAGLSMKDGVKIHDCRKDSTMKNKAVWVNGINLYTIVHPDNA